MNGYILTTKSGSVYTVTSKEGTPYQTLSGGKLPHSLEIEPTHYCMQNEKWKCNAIENPENNNFRGTVFQTSEVEKVRVFNTDKSVTRRVPTDQYGNAYDGDYSSEKSSKRRLPNVSMSSGVDQYGNAYEGLY